MLLLSQLCDSSVNDIAICSVRVGFIGFSLLKQPNLLNVPLSCIWNGVDWFHAITKFFDQSHTNLTLANVCTYTDANERNIVSIADAIFWGGSHINLDFGVLVSFHCRVVVRMCVVFGVATICIRELLWYSLLFIQKYDEIRLYVMESESPSNVRSVIIHQHKIYSLYPSEFGLNLLELLRVFIDSTSRYSIDWIRIWLKNRDFFFNI